MGSGNTENGWQTGRRSTVALKEVVERERERQRLPDEGIRTQTVGMEGLEAPSPLQ